MNLMWFENFWMVDGVAFVLVLAICSFFVLELFSMFAFGSSLLSGFNFSFVVLVVIVLNFGFSVLFFGLASFNINYLSVSHNIFTIKFINFISNLPFFRVCIRYFCKRFELWCSTPKFELTFQTICLITLKKAAWVRIFKDRFKLKIWLSINIT